MKRVGPKRVSLFEAGAGEVPFGLLGQALKAERKRRGRQFTAVDMKLNATEALRQRGLREAPKNLKLVKNCVVNELKKLPSSSQDIVFESYFLNCYSTRKGSDFYVFEKVAEYLNAAKRVLKPKGRIILIQSHVNAELFAKAAREFGFKTHIALIPEKLLEQSTAEWIEKRANPHARRELMNRLMLNDSTMISWSEEFARKNKLKEASDSHTPVAIILRK